MAEDWRIRVTLGSDGGSIPAGTMASYFESDPRVAATAPWVKITLSGIRYEAAPGASGPGQFSLWQTGGFGGPSFGSPPPATWASA